MNITAAQAVFVTAIVLFTAFTAWTDIKWRKVPNNITVPMFVAGLVWQLAFHGFPGLLNAVYGFGIGFGILFVLWIVGSAGGGDVKLLGALSVWLGPGLTLKVMLGSLMFVILGTFGVIFYSFVTRGYRGTKKQFSRGGQDTSKRKSKTVATRQKRRVMAFAMPVALATWCVLLLFRQQW